MSTYNGIDISLLKRVLLLESKKGYNDGTIYGGGLDDFICNWLNTNKPKLGSSLRAAKFKSLRLDNPGYSGKNLSGRKGWIEEVLTWLDELESGRLATEVQTRDEPKLEKPRPVKNISPVAGKHADLDLPATVIKGVGDDTAKKFARLGLRTIRDLLYFFPRRFLDFSQRRAISELETGKDQTIFAIVWEAHVTRLGRMKSTEAVLGDETGNIRAVWFNQPYVARQLKTNSHIAVSGRVNEFNYTKVFENPEWELFEDKDLVHTGRLIPVYPLTQGLFPRGVRTIIKRAVDGYAGSLEEFVPRPIRDRCGLMELPSAIAQAHYPDDYLSQNRSRQRLAFDELFLLQLGVLGRKREWQEDQPGHKFNIDNEYIADFVKRLPFALTGAQKRTIKEILGDLSREVPMSRLLQGDVGSGKTVVATVALLAAVANGYQGAFMAPTEILAEQHFSTLYKLMSAVSSDVERESSIYTFRGFPQADLTIALLTGSLSARDKAKIHQRTGEGRINILIGTHALIQKEVNFEKLGLVVIDEQHRFGVLQRSALRQKGFNPHLLVMTATPIPRTLALTLYGDLDISTINEMPPGRQTIKTRWLKQVDRERAYRFIRKQVVEGRQTFIICPLIEESENLDVKAAVAEYENLSGTVFPDLKLGLLHGRMKGAEKEGVMHDFKDGKLDILVSTSVVEVGIDVPNATVMLVEAADRFGLAQLHQFRGRVGRGEKQSYCMLLSENPSEYGQERLKAIEEISDGFLLAEKDLELRGPGEFFGTRQSGLPDLKMAKLSDTQLLEIARREAKILFEADPGLKSAEHQAIARELNRVWQSRVENN